MGNIISNSTINRFIICCTLGTFAFTIVSPLQAIQMEKGVDINLNDINFGIRIEKLIKKAKNYFSKKNSHKLTEIMWDIKREIEGYTGQKINIDHHLDQIEKEAKSRGKPIDKSYIKEMRKRFKQQEKRLNHKAMYITTCIECDLPYNSEEESIMFQNELAISNDYLMTKSSHGKHKDKDKDEEIILPLRVTIGVTMSLIGLFLYVVPFPICKAAAPWVLDTGLAFLLDQGVTEWEERQKEDKR